MTQLLMGAYPGMVPIRTLMYTDAIERRFCRWSSVCWTSVSQSPNEPRAYQTHSFFRVGCFEGILFNSNCDKGRNIKTPQQWGDIVRAQYPGYNGTRPRLQLWHGQDGMLGVDFIAKSIR